MAFDSSLREINWGVCREWVRKRERLSGVRNITTTKEKTLLTIVAQNPYVTTSRLQIELSG
jgi:hypothetical protein